MTNTQTKMLIIGSGSFIAQTVLPALLINKNDIEVSAIINKSGELSVEIQKHLPKIPIYTEIKAANELAFDILFICVPQKVVASVLEQLICYKLTDKKIILSTPALPLNAFKNFLLLRKFTTVIAFEFVPFLKTYQVAKSLIDDGKIGTVKKIQFNHSGYLYHAMSSLRFLANKKMISSIKSIRFGCFNEYAIKFFRGPTATVLEPRDYNVGSFMIAGTNGIISDYPINIKDHLFIRVICDKNNVYQHITVNDEVITPSLIDTKATLYFDTIEIKVDVTRQLFIIAAATLLDEIIKDERNENQEALPSCANTIYEHLIIRISKKFGYYVNPIAFLGLSPIYRVINWLTAKRK